MKQIIFDAGPIISLTTNNLLSILPEMKERANAAFIMPKAVYGEVVERPLQTKKFKFEALQVMKLVREGVFDLVDAAPIVELTNKIENYANSVYVLNGKPLKVLQAGELSTLAVALYRSADACVVDERTTRLMIEHPEHMKEILEHRMNAKITINKTALDEFRKITSTIHIIRSVEMVAIAFEMGLFNAFLPSVPHAKHILLESLLWGVKLQGCAVSEEEIANIIATLS